MSENTLKTPMLQQYLKIKKSFHDAILFFRMGDFYEMFYDDALIASKELEIVLTSRNKSKEENVPMCGVPWHSAENYIARLIKKGYKVAICEQMEDPSQSKGLVKREVIRVYTPSTFDGENFETSTERFLLSVVASKNSIGVALVEPTTGELKTADIALEEAQSKMMDLLSIFDVQEIIYPLSHSLGSLIPNHSEISSTALPDWVFERDYARSTLMEHFKINTLQHYGIEKHAMCIAASGAALHYLKDIQKSDLPHINTIRYINFSELLILDSVTVRNLELIKNMVSQTKDASLYAILDLTCTPGGSRLLKHWIVHPLLNKKEIESRLHAVDELNKSTIERGSLRNLLKPVVDLERICSRISTETVNPKDLLLLFQTLKVIPDVKNILAGFSSLFVKDIDQSLQESPDVKNFIHEGIKEKPAAAIKEGGIIKDGFSAELDELRKIIRSGKDYLARLEQDERKRTGINNLKISYNKVFGYYIEITKSNLSMAPADYERKQTLVNAERFITPKLKEYEEKILGGEEKIIQLEYELYCEIRTKIKAHLQELQTTSKNLAVLDVILALSEAACRYNYCKPKLHTGTHISITKGRHPVIERLQFEQFIPNDTLCDNLNDQILIITGPNMGGKSTYLRQVALICLMAHMGSFIPAEKAEICLIDRIFTRVGASDNLVQGQSTFMTEMIETSNILNNATSRSLIILDEIGRGTSTFDGMAIAWSLIEYMHNNLKIAAKTLFATHFHELTALSAFLPHIKNYSIAVKEMNDQIIFLRKIIQGPSDKSYGIQVARLAGLPGGLISRSKEILSMLEQSKESDQIMHHIQNRADSAEPIRTSSLANGILTELENTNLDALSPLEAFHLLLSLKQKIKNQ